MPRFDKWGGLLTYASPYAVPAGAAVSQINLTCSFMGQLTVRDGMQPLKFAEGSVTQCVDVGSYSYQGVPKLLVLDEAGGLSVLDAPDRDAPLGAPYLPSLPFSGDQIHVGYDYRWNENGDDVVDGTKYFDTIFGGYAGTKTWPGSVNANASCGGTTVTHYFGGRANSVYTPSLRYQIDICP
jgi:hypothetical protein